MAELILSGSIRISVAGSRPKVVRVHTGLPSLMTQSTPFTLTQRSVVGPRNVHAAAQDHQGRIAPGRGGLAVGLAQLGLADRIRERHHHGGAGRVRRVLGGRDVDHRGAGAEQDPCGCRRGQNAERTCGSRETEELHCLSLSLPNIRYCQPAVEAAVDYLAPYRRVHLGRTVQLWGAADNDVRSGHNRAH